jgi:hypothetical protein
MTLLSAGASPSKEIHPDSSANHSSAVLRPDEDESGSNSRSPNVACPNNCFGRTASSADHLFATQLSVPPASPLLDSGDLGVTAASHASRGAQGRVKGASRARSRQQGCLPKAATGLRALQGGCAAAPSTSALDARCLLPPAFLRAPLRDLCASAVRSFQVRSSTLPRPPHRVVFPKCIENPHVSPV